LGDTVSIQRRGGLLQECNFEQVWLAADGGHDETTHAQPISCNIAEFPYY